LLLSFLPLFVFASSYFIVLAGQRYNSIAIF